MKSLSGVRLFAIPWTVACKAPLSMRFSRQENWSELPLPSPGDLPDPGIKPESPPLAGGFFTTELPEKPRLQYRVNLTFKKFFPGGLVVKNLPANGVAKSCT